MTCLADNNQMQKGPEMIVQVRPPLRQTENVKSTKQFQNFRNARLPVYPLQIRGKCASDSWDLGYRIVCQADW